MQDLLKTIFFVACLRLFGERGELESCEDLARSRDQNARPDTFDFHRRPKSTLNKLTSAADRVSYSPLTDK